MKALLEKNPFLTLILSTLGGVIVFIGVFYLWAKGAVDYDYLSPGQYSQEEMGYIEAVGGWAIGLAGAWVAIAIAGVATQLQKNDSIKERVDTLRSDIHRVSQLNSDIVVALLDAKRASLTAIMEIKASQKHNKRTEWRSGINDFENGQAFQPFSEAKKPVRVSQENLSYLGDKLVDLIKKMENAVRDPVFRGILFSNQDNHCIQPLGQAKDSLVFRETMVELLDVIALDEKSSNFIRLYSQSTHNFGLGVADIKIGEPYQQYKQDIDYYLEMIDSGKLENDEAAWLFLGALLLVQDSELFHGKCNEGVFLLFHMLGSLPNKGDVEAYLKTEVDSYKKNGGEAGELLEDTVKGLADHIYFPSALSEKSLDEVREALAEMGNASVSLSKSELDRQIERLEQIRNRQSMQWDEGFMKTIFELSWKIFRAPHLIEIKSRVDGRSKTSDENNILSNRSASKE